MVSGQLSFVVSLKKWSFSFSRLLYVSFCPELTPPTKRMVGILGFFLLAFGLFLFHMPV